MKRNDIINAITQLSYSQGFYGRLLRDLQSLDEETYDEVMTELEAQNFSDTVDMVLFFEC